MIDSRKFGKAFIVLGVLCASVIHQECRAASVDGPDITCNGVHNVGGTNVPLNPIPENVRIRFLGDGRIGVKWGGPQGMTLKVCDKDNNCTISDLSQPEQMICAPEEKCDIKRDDFEIEVQRNLGLNTMMMYSERMFLKQQYKKIEYSGGGFEMGWSFVGDCTATDPNQ